jgi:hypothetical protein
LTLIDSLPILALISFISQFKAKEHWGKGLAMASAEKKAGQ